MSSPTHGPRVFVLDPASFTPGLGIPLVRHLKQLGYAVDFGSTRSIRGESLPDADFLFFRATYAARRWLLPRPRLRQFARGLEYLFDQARLYRRIRRDGYSIVHYIWMPVPRIDNALVKILRRQGIRVMLTACNPRSHEATQMSRSDLRTLGGVDHIITLTQFTRDCIVQEAGIALAKFTVIPRGDLEGFLGDAVPASEFLPPDFTDKPLAVFLGLIRPYKGLPDLLAAWPSVVDQIPEARLVIAGQFYANVGGVGRPAPVDDATRASLNALGPARDTVFTEFAYVPAPRYHGLLEAATVLVQPYRGGSQSGNTVQALKLGVPVVCTRVGGLPEMVLDGVTGEVVDPGDIEQLATALVRTLRANRSGELSAQCRAFSERFDWPSIAQSTAEVYLELTNSSELPMTEVADLDTDDATPIDGR